MSSGAWERLRKRKEKTEEDHSVDLGSDEHAWWAGREDLEEGVPTGRRPRRPDAAPPPKSGFEEYFPTDSLFAAPPGPADPPDPLDDPYGTLGLTDAATWEQITVRHRLLAKEHHPDRLLGLPAAVRQRSEARIRDLNIAYTELRKRRGR